LNDRNKRTLKLGVIGLGRAFGLMLPTFTGDKRIALVAAADTRAGARQRFAADFNGKAYGTAEELCADPEVEIVYVATPHQLHAQQAVLAARHGKHLLIEKPLALTLEDCAAINAAVRAAGVHLVVGHSHSFDAPVQRLRALVQSGAYGAVRMINAINYTDYLYRPRRPEELDTALGGGAIYNQAAHQVDIVRFVAGDAVTGVRALTGAWNKARPTEGAYAALLTFAGGAFASLTYNGFGHFDSDEWQGWLGEMGQQKAPPSGAPRRTFTNMQEETAYKVSRNYGGENYKPEIDVPPVAHNHFGTLLVSCDRADLRAMPNGVMIYENGSGRLDALPPPAVPRSEVIDELYSAIVGGETPVHDGRWAMATMAVILAMLRSAREGHDVAL
jgi:phthalate 4,5-cis-dihydrodiol dehydrogenase